MVVTLSISPVDKTSIYGLIGNIHFYVAIDTSKIVSLCKPFMFYRLILDYER